MVFLTHQSSSPSLDIGARIILNLFQTSMDVRSVGVDVPRSRRVPWVHVVLIRR